MSRICAVDETNAFIGQTRGRPLLLISRYDYTKQMSRDQHAYAASYKISPRFAIYRAYQITS